MITNNISENNYKYRKLGIFVDNIALHCSIFAKQSPQNALNHVIIVANEGSIGLKIHENTVIIHKNEALLLRKNIKYEVCEENVTKDETNLECIYFNGNGSTNILDYLELGDIFLFSMSGNTCKLHYDTIKRLHEAGEYFRASIELQLLLIDAREAFAVNYRQLNMENVYSYINEHFKEPMDLNILSAYYGSSISYFSRAFKQVFHETPMNYVNRIRIDHAMELLTSTNMTVSSVSEACGFDKMEYFCYVFKKHEGCTPTQYRLKRKNLDKI